MEELEQAPPAPPSAPAKQSWAEKMKEAKAKKAAGLPPTPPAPPSAPYNRPPYNPIPKPKPQPPKKQIKPAEQFIFRLIKKIHPSLDKINVDFKWKAHTFLPSTSLIDWPFKISGNEQVPLPLNDNLNDLNDEYGMIREDIQYLPREVRYIFSAKSPFVDEQEKQFGDTLKRDPNGFNQILDNARNRDALQFSGPEIKVGSFDSVLINFLRIHGMCINIHPKAHRRSQLPIYQMIDFGQLDKTKVDLGRKRKAMYEIASNAKLEEMIPHAKHLGIDFIWAETGLERDLDAIREDYKDAALANPEEFERTFRDPKIKIMHQIITLKDSGQLVISAGRAKWAFSNAIITLIPGNANPVEFLANFSLENRDFQEQLEASKVSL